jgi:putative oxidoreductase
MLPPSASLGRRIHSAIQEETMPDWGWNLYPYVHLVGRVLFAMLFIVSGINHFTQFGGMAGYAAAKHVPAPKLAVGVSGLMILVGGLMILLGWHRLWGAGLLVIFLVLAAFLVHPFWKETDPMARAGERAHFLKDLALAGAALFIAYYSYTTWPLSLGG